MPGEPKHPFNASEAEPAGRRFHKAAFALFVGAFGAALLVGLGIWQVQRLEWKQGVLSTMDARISAPPVTLPEFPDPIRDNYLSVEASGRTGDGEILVQTSRRDLGPGFRLIVPFETEGRTVMLDRGHLPARLRNGDRGTNLDAEVLGNLHWPDEFDRLFTPEPDGVIWYARDVPAMADALGAEPVLIVARRDSSAPEGVVSWPVSSSGIPNDHFQYAVTWFSLAAIWLGMTGFWIWRNTRPPNSKRSSRIV